MGSAAVAEYRPGHAQLVGSIDAAAGPAGHRGYRSYLEGVCTPPASGAPATVDRLLS